MFAFGAASEAKLATVHEELRDSCFVALSWQAFDFGISFGFRSEPEQNQAFISGASTKRWPNSEHNVVGPNGEPLSNAIDFYPWVELADGSMGIPWNDTHAFCLVAGVIIAAGASQGVRLRSGADWNGNGRTKDQRLMDFGHIERYVA